MVDYNKKIINVWWSKTPLPGNFGDILTPYIIEKLTGFKAVHTQPQTSSDHVLLGIGSIIDKTTPNTIVWGSGCMSKDTCASLHSTYLAVRGPLTRDIISNRGIKCPEIYGDPALLLPNLYQPIIGKKYKIGIFTHYVDYNKVSQWYGNDDNIKIINPIDKNIENVVNQMLQCERIISSSLHGIIVSNAYNIPTIWVKFSDLLSGDDTKFSDYFLSQGVKQTFTKINHKLTLESLLNLSYFETKEFDSEPLLKAFPIKERI